MKEIQIGKFVIRDGVMNGAGPIKTVEDVKQMARTPADVIIVGSITVEKRDGNSGNTFYMSPNQLYTLNSKGLPNEGIVYYQQKLPELVQIAHDHGKPLIVSVAGFNKEEYARLSQEVINTGVDGVELNFGCPNIWGSDNTQKQILSFNQDAMYETLNSVESEVGEARWISTKLSPYSDPSQLEKVARVLSLFPINAVVTSNTFPNGMDFKDNEPVINYGAGLAGVAGSALKPIALGQVSQFSKLLPSEVKLIGVGGVKDKKDVADYIKAGASAVQITSGFIAQGSSIFSEVK